MGPMMPSLKRPSSMVRHEHEAHGRLMWHTVPKKQQIRNRGKNVVSHADKNERQCKLSAQHISLLFLFRGWGGRSQGGEEVPRVPSQDEGVSNLTEDTVQIKGTSEAVETEPQVIILKSFELLGNTKRRCMALL